MNEITLTDQVGRNISLVGQAQKIICLVPSITELLFTLGLEDQIIGRTNYCIFPDEAFEKPIVGGTKTVRYDKIKALAPDLIITNKEENTEEIVKTCEAICPVYVSNVQTIHSALQMITDIGMLTDRADQSEELVQEIEARRERWYKTQRQTYSCIYLIWKDPFMTIGVDTFIFHMLQEVGFENDLYDFRYPEVTIEQIQKIKPGYVLLSSEPFEFSDGHQQELSQELTDSKVLLVDGSYFSWYGSRILQAYDYFEGLTQSIEPKI